MDWELPVPFWVHVVEVSDQLLEAIVVGYLKCICAHYTEWDAAKIAVVLFINISVGCPRLYKYQKWLKHIILCRGEIMNELWTSYGLYAALWALIYWHHFIEFVNNCQWYVHPQLIVVVYIQYWYLCLINFKNHKFIRLVLLF